MMNKLMMIVQINQSINQLLKSPMLFEGSELDFRFRLYSLFVSPLHSSIPNSQVLPTAPSFNSQ